MDINGTRFHLLHGHDDWYACWLDDGDQSLAELWQQSASPPSDRPPLEWSQDAGALGLRQEVPLFRLSRRTPPLDLGARRGAGRDRYGNWFWIGPDESSIHVLTQGARQSVPWWNAADRDQACAPSPPGAFTACLPPPPPGGLQLRGLAITTQQYLVVGDVGEKGLLLFDLYRGGPPQLLLWPAGVPFAPWDLAATPDGGVLVLDRDNLTYWALDATFRVPALVDADQLTTFQPQSAGAPRHVVRGASHPQGHLLSDGSPPAALSPISIESTPDGSVLILDTDPARPYSLIYEYRDGVLVATYSLEHSFEAVDPSQAKGITTLYSVAGHDFAVLVPAPSTPSTTDATGAASTTGAAGAGSLTGNCGCSGAATGAADQQDAPDQQAPAVVYVGERAGKQVMAFVLDRDQQRAIAQRTYLPLRHWQGKGLEVAGDQVFYDFQDRWVPVAAYTECHYAGSAVLTTPLHFGPEIPGRPFDGRDPGCVWHRLMLDAQIPSGTAVQVEARACDDPDLLGQVPWSRQPDPYMRSDGAELPYYDPWAPRPATGVPEGTGTWELLFQQISGRYLQLRLTILGTGRSTPRLRALRAWYPRFSYAEHYLPAIYREDPTATSFLTRWLANFEGFYTRLEDQIEQVAELFDGRTAPVEALQWLACWFGVVLDPLWTENQRRFFLRHMDAFFRLRGTVPGLEIAVRLYLDQQLQDSLFDRRCWGTSTVRIVERFLTRRIGGAVYGDPTEPGTPLQGPLTPAVVAASAHRFVVLVPEGLTDEDTAMVERIVELAKPAHTQFEVRRYWDLFQVGMARLGLDTRLGNSSRFAPLVLGTSALPGVYLQPPYPFDIGDRIVLDRDRLGNLPRL